MQKELDNKLQNLTENIIDSTLLVGSLLGVLLYFLSLLNYPHTGFRIAFVSDFLIILALLIVTYYRKKIPINIKSHIIISVLFVLFITDTIELGATSENRIFIILIPFYSFLVFPLRKVIYIYASAIIIFLGIGILYNLGIIRSSIDLSSRNLLINTWILNIISITIVSFIVLVIMIRFRNEYDRLIDNMQKSNKKLTEQERYYRIIFNTTNNGIFIYSDTGKLLDVNNAAIEMYGYNSPKDLLDTDITKLSYSDKETVIKQRIFYLKEIKEKGYVNFDWKARKKDGTPFWIHAEIKKIFIGKEERILSVVKDITQQKEDTIQLKLYRNHLKKLVKERTKQLHKANKELKKSNESLKQQKEEITAAFEELQNIQQQLIQSEKMASLGVLAAGIAHEINNPLNFIQGGVYGIEQYFSENPNNYESIKPLFDGIKEGVKRASEIVASLNHFSRAEFKKEEVCNIHDIIENCLVILKNRLKNNITIIKNYTDAEYILIGNEGKLHQAMMNILMNAIQAIKNSGKIEITTLVEYNNLIIKVKDNGIGIDNENLNKIFDPFFTTKNVGEGTGLGLSITLKIIQEHHGEIIYNSKQGIGTEVVVQLPVKQKKE